MTDLVALERFAFLTLPNYSMIALSNALEACRMANYAAGRAAYRWQVATLDGTPALASNGLSLQPTVALADAEFDLLLVCGGIDVRLGTGLRLKAALRRLAHEGVMLGALCTGTFALAEAGLLDSYRCAIHWENLDAIREEFSEVAFVEDLFVIDRDRITCTGGIAPLDMMLALIEARLGHDIAAKVADEFIVARARPATDRQRQALPAPIGRRPPVLERVAALMERHIEAPLPIPEIADGVGLSPRQLERLFKAHLGVKPTSFYASLRLDRARHLLRQSELSATEIAVACGFQSPSHFSRAYGRQFGHSPRAERRR